MHLADHDESFVGGRIWTEPAQITHRLADLTGFHDELIWVLLAVGLNASISVALVTWLKRRPLTLARVAAIGVPFAAPALTLVFAAVVATGVVGAGGLLGRALRRSQQAG